LTGYRTLPSLIELERSYALTPAQLFAVWSDPVALMRWGMPHGWEVVFKSF
jgi:uncharacterized protein YndB with AHSA1/START domain